MATPLRNIRVPDELWEAALAKATDQGTSLSDVIRTLLEDYVEVAEPVA